MNLKNTFALATLGLGITLQAHAETIYVDQRYGPGGTGTSNAPYNTIQAALANNNASVIIIYPGTYSERLDVTRSVTILGYDGPHTTKLEASAGGDAVSLRSGISVTIQGLTISSGERGVYQPTTGTLYLKNCIICGNTSHGIMVERTESQNAPNVFVDNCIVVANGGSGLYLTLYDFGYNGRYAPDVRAFNNIFSANQRFCVEANYDDWGRGYVGGTITLDYNDYVGSGLGNYSGLFGPGQEISVGTNSFTLAPEFIGGSAGICNQDFRLLPTSPCKNAGQPGLGWLNPDGTRNDLGAYGGPGAATFYTNPNDGPIIRNVTIDQGMVPKGSTFTIRATGAVR